MAHLDDIALNAHADGDADHGDHLAACEACAARLGALRSVMNAVGSPPPPLATASRDRALAAALAAGGSLDWSGPATGANPASATTTDATIIDLASRRQARTRLVAIAAVALLALGAIPVLFNGMGRDRGLTSAASGPAKDAAEAQAPTDRALNDATTSNGNGAFADRNTATESDGQSASGGSAAAFANPINDGHIGERSTTTDIGRVARARLDAPSGGDDANPAQLECGAAARTGADGDLGDEVYVARVRYQGSEAEAHVFRVAGADDYSLQVMRRSDCRRLAQARI
ncbi:MAG: hypothetical protein ACR2H3_12760 [Acidimicrobiales bacterium]